jgi:arsenate reductase (thioredoxin)
MLRVWIVLSVLALSPLTFAQSNSTVTALAFAHMHAKPDALHPGNDRALKVALISAIAEHKALPAAVVQAYFDVASIRGLSKDGSLSLAAMEAAVTAHTVPGRAKLHPALKQHADLLSTQFDQIDPVHRDSTAALAAWIVKHYDPERPLGIIIICTGNTRRSMLGAAMGNLAASYQGLANIRFGSGGTDPVAFNPRTIASLKAIGFAIDDLQKEAPRGSKNEPNPQYRVQWGDGLHTTEYSKKYTDSINPKSDFAAILVCSEADASCPKVNGASLRLPVPYIDPKAFDGAPFEAAKYAERRDDMGRFMLNATLQARRQLLLAGKLK